MRLQRQGRSSRQSGPRPTNRHPVGRTAVGIVATCRKLPSVPVRDDLRGARGLPLAAGRRARPAEHQRVARRRRRPRGATRSPPSCPASSGTAIPTAPPPRCATAIAELHGVRPDQVFAANGSQRGAADAAARPTPARAARWRRSSRPTSCTATSPGSPARRWSRASAPPTSRSTSPRSPGASTRPARRHVPVLAEQPDRAGRAGVHRARRARRGARARGGRRGLRAVRRLVGARPGRRRPPARGHPHVLQDVVDGRRAASATSSARRGWSPSSTRSCCRTTSTRPSRSPAAWRCGSPTRWRSGSQLIVAERERIAAALADAAGATCSPAAPTSSCSGRAPTAGQDVWQELLDRSVLVRDCSSWPRLDDCLRVTIGTPDENDAFLAALARGARVTDRAGVGRRHADHEGDVDRADDRPRRHRASPTSPPASRSTTTCSTSSAGTAAST